jgi:hypothetical protein
LAVDWEFGAAVTGRRVFIFGHGGLSAKRFGLAITDDRQQTGARTPAAVFDPLPV